MATTLPPWVVLYLICSLQVDNTSCINSLSYVKQFQYRWRDGDPIDCKTKTVLSNVPVLFCLIYYWLDSLDILTNDSCLCHSRFAKDRMVFVPPHGDRLLWKNFLWSLLLFWHSTVISIETYMRPLMPHWISRTPNRKKIDRTHLRSHVCGSRWKSAFSEANNSVGWIWFNNWPNVLSPSSQYSRVIPMVWAYCLQRSASVQFNGLLWGRKRIRHLFPKQPPVYDSQGGIPSKMLFCLREIFFDIRHRFWTVVPSDDTSWRRRIARERFQCASGVAADRAHSCREPFRCRSARRTPWMTLWLVGAACDGPSEHAEAPAPHGQGTRWQALHSRTRVMGKDLVVIALCIFLPTHVWVITTLRASLECYVVAVSVEYQPTIRSFQKHPYWDWAEGKDIPCVWCLWHTGLVCHA